MIITPGMAVIILVGYGIYKIWNKRPIHNRDFVLLFFLFLVPAILVVVGSLKGLTDQVPEKMRPILKNVIESKSEDSIISSMQALNRKPHICNTMLEKRKDENWVIKFLVWPVHMPWAHVFGREKVEKYQAQWKLGDTYYKATVVL